MGGPFSAARAAGSNSTLFIPLPLSHPHSLPVARAECMPVWRHCPGECLRLHPLTTSVLPRLGWEAERLLQSRAVICLPSYECL